jgi:hypothetical protein
MGAVGSDLYRTQAELRQSGGEALFLQWRCRIEKPLKETLGAPYQPSEHGEPPPSPL